MNGACRPRRDAEKHGGAPVWVDSEAKSDPNASWRSPGFSQTDDHPVTCVSWNDARAFCDWLSKRERSRALLSFLYAHVSRPEFAVRFRWRANSIAMWDNRCTQHRVVADNMACERRMERITLLGDKPY